jgi:hypothetical protein
MDKTFALNLHSIHPCACQYHLHRPGMGDPPRQSPRSSMRGHPVILYLRENKCASSLASRILQAGASSRHSPVAFPQITAMTGCLSLQLALRERMSTPYREVRIGYLPLEAEYHNAGLFVPINPIADSGRLKKLCGGRISIRTDHQVHNPAMPHFLIGHKAR